MRTESEASGSGGCAGDFVGDPREGHYGVLVDMSCLHWRKPGLLIRRRMLDLLSLIGWLACIVSLLRLQEDVILCTTKASRFSLKYLSVPV